MNKISEAYSGKDILVTGGAGSIGSRLVKGLLDAGAGRVTAVDNLSASLRWNLPDDKRLRFVNADILDEKKMSRVFSDKPSKIFHLAAFFANERSVRYPEKDLLVNGLGTLIMLRYAGAYAPESFVYASSGVSVYGRRAQIPYREEDLKAEGFTTPYQITKMLGEHYCSYFFKRDGLPAVRARIFSSFGPGEIPGEYRNVIPNFIMKALSGEDLLITGSGQESRDFTYVDDVVRGLMLAGASPEAAGEAVNIAAGREVKILYTAERIIQLTASKSSIRLSEKREWDSKERVLASLEKAGNLIGYKPAVSFEEGLKNTVEWIKNNYNRIKNSPNGTDDERYSIVSD